MDSNVPPEINSPPPLNPAPPPPPYNRPPPPVISPMPPRPPRRGTGWKIFAIILVVLLGVSLLFNVRHAARTIFSAKMNTFNNMNAYGPRLEEVTLKEAEGSSNKIVVIPIQGIISGEPLERGEYSMVTLVKEQLKRAKEDDEVRAVLLKVDSPGGEVLASDEIAKAIREFQIKSSKPVVVSMGSLAASGGYYISAPCEYIVANELTITGSIGVIMHGLNYRGLLDKIGVQPEVFKSGKYKDMLSPTKTPEEISPEEKQMVQNMIDETFGKFKSVVAEGREASYQSNKKQGRALSPDWQDYADGRILSGKEAYKLGFVDDLGDFDVAVDRAEQLSHSSKAELIQYQPIFDISNLFRLFGKTDAKPLRLELGVDFPKLHAGYMYFLSPTYLQ